MKKLLFSVLVTMLSIGFVQAQDLKDSFEVYFEYNKAILKAESKATIDKFLSSTAGRRLKVRVTGHTCDLGSDNYNMGLSEKRAVSAFDYLKSVGEQEDKIELFFYGEKELKYGKGGKSENRRVFVLFALEDDDKDTLIKSGCIELNVEKGSFKPVKVKDVVFDYKTFNTANAIKTANIKLEDERGNKYYTNGIVYFKAMSAGNSLTTLKPIKVKFPAVGADETGFMLYTGVEKNGSIIWKSTGRSCGSVEKSMDCGTYNIDIMDNGYCACLKQKPCPEDCCENPFGGEKAPNGTEKDVRASSSKTMAKLPEGMFKGENKDLNITVQDDANFDDDLDICEQFMFGITTDDWFKARNNVKNAKQNIIVKATNAAGNTLYGDNGKSTRIFISKDKVAGMENPILLPGNRLQKGYLRWDIAYNSQVKCLGPVNCDYVVFDVPAGGFYKLAEWVDAKEEKVEETYLLKTRLVKKATVMVGNKADNTVYIAKNNSKNGKQKEKEYRLKDNEDMNQLVVLVKHETSKGKTYAEVKLSDLKYKAKKKMYVMRKKELKKVADYNEMKLSKCK